MLTLEQKNQFNDIFEELGRELDISEYQFNAAVKSYQAVGQHLAKEDSLLAPYKPEILPQGSFMLGTMIKPVIESDDLDIDLVCQLTGKNNAWTQYDLKQRVGSQLRASKVYREMLKTEGRRCWTLVYADDSNYHMDILPSIVDSGYRLILENTFSGAQSLDHDQIAIRITDSERDDYSTETDHKMWLKSNPFGYGYWFFDRAALGISGVRNLSEFIKPLPKYRKEKLPLQRVVQILKRHRDFMFKGDEHKPISIIITTLAARAYNKEGSLLDALYNIIRHMPDHIEERENIETGKTVKWISNPVNDDENFADKWEETPEKEIKFYEWMNAVQNDLQKILKHRDHGIHKIITEMKHSFGERETNMAFKKYGDKQLQLRESDKLKMATATGTLGKKGRTTITKHTNYGT